MSLLWWRANLPLNSFKTLSRLYCNLIIFNGKSVWYKSTISKLRSCVIGFIVYFDKSNNTYHEPHVGNWMEMSRHLNLPRD